MARKNRNAESVATIPAIDQLPRLSENERVELELALSAIGRADSLVNVAHLTLEAADGEVEHDCAQVLGDPTYSELEAARGHINKVLKGSAGQEGAAAVALTVDDLPRLSDDDREAAESGYAALEGTPIGDEPASDDQAAEAPVFLNESHQPIAGLPARAPCPFCKWHRNRDIYIAQIRGTHRVHCDACGAEGPLSESAPEAAELWNKANSVPGDDEPIGGANKAMDVLLRALAILDCYTDTVPDERAADRYVLWAVREKIEEGYDVVEALS